MSNLTQRILSFLTVSKYRRRKVGLVYKDFRQAHNTTVVGTASNVFVDDTAAILTFTLTKSRVVLVLYNASHKYNEYSVQRGAMFGINVDNVDVARIDSSVYASTPAVGPYGAVVVWAGILAAGSHTIKGRLASVAGAGYTVQVTERYLTVVLFEGTAADFSYTQSAVAANTTSGTLQNDPNAVANLNLGEAQKALILYSVCNYQGATEGAMGKAVAIQTDGVDGLTMRSQIPRDVDYPDNAFIAEIRNLTAGPHTIQGRFCSQQNLVQVTISERQFAVLLLPTDLETDFVESTQDVVMGGTAYANDTPALISRSISAQRMLLGIYSVSKAYGAGVNCYYGTKIALNIGGTDYFLNNQTVWDTWDRGIGTAGHLFMSLLSGSYNVQGRFAQVYSAVGQNETRIEDRTLCLLWFPPSEEAPPPPPLEAYQTKEEKQETNQASVLHGCTRLRMIHRVTRIVPWVV
jgi:hypothetical protein